MLHGTMDTGDPATSRAFIAASGGASAGSYRIGDRLPGGEILREIGNDSIQVGQGGSSRSLALRDTPASRPLPARTRTRDDDGPLFYDPELEAVAASDAGNELSTAYPVESIESAAPASTQTRSRPGRNVYFPDGLDQ